jgi:elongation factor Ts
MTTSLHLVQLLRTTTGAGILDCQKALVSANNDFEQAVLILKTKSSLSSEKKKNKETLYGTIVSYIHSGARLGVLLELNCETDFVAKSPKFIELATNLAMHIAGTEECPDTYCTNVTQIHTELLSQAYIKDNTITISELISQYIYLTGENIRIIRYVKFNLQ